MSDRVSVRVGEKIRRRLAAAARTTGRKESAIVRAALEDYLPAGTTCLDLARRHGLVGRARGLPKDLSTNKRHLQGFGR